MNNLFNFAIECNLVMEAVSYHIHTQERGLYKVFTPEGEYLGTFQNSACYKGSTLKEK